MTNDAQNRTETRHVESPGKASAIEADQAKDDRLESAANHVRTNWAWANGRWGYDWMDSHYLLTDFT
jgi:hypothetical protein